MLQISVEVAQTEFIADNRSVLYWPQNKSLILSDLHFGKTAHFRKSGVNVPQKIFKEDLFRLIDCIQYFSPQKIIIVGDLFHSNKNNEIEIFKEWRNKYKKIEFELIGGNHDENTKHLVKELGLEYYNKLIQNNILFIHNPDFADETTEEFVVAGHWHPAVKISGRGKQNLVFPCFYIDEKKLILPAFSKFSGYFVQEKNKNNKIIAIVNNSLVCI